MPGDVSYSYDPEFGTSANCHEVEKAVKGAIHRLTVVLGPELAPILEVISDDRFERFTEQVTLTEREMRVIRFALIRSLETF